jgi:transposase
MQEDSTYLLEKSTGWIVDWSHPRYEICRDERIGIPYGKITYRVSKEPSRDWKVELPEGQWYKHSNEVILLKHCSSGVTLICLEAHYESYVNKYGRRRRTDVIGFRNGNNSYTNHFRDNIAYFMSGYGMTISRCARICHTTPAIVKEVNKARLLSLAGDMKPCHYSPYICVDEFLIEHGHRYCTIVIDAQTGELLYLEKGKKKQQLKHFFKWVGDGFMNHVKAISMDMNANYSAAIQESFPHIKIVYDTFHIVKWFNDQVIDAARRTEGNRLKKLAGKLVQEGRKDEATLVLEERKLLFGSRFLLLANIRTLKAKDKVNAELNAEAKKSAEQDGLNPDRTGHRRTDNCASRDAILKTNENLQNAVKAREELVEILSCSNPEQMRVDLTTWVKVYSSVGISQLTRFTRTITNRMEGIVSRALAPINSGRIEGVNGFIKAQRRSAFGYQDFDYFALIIWEQTHSKTRQNLIDPTKEKRSYSRTKPYNKKRLKQTVFILPEPDSKQAV